jgi:hypothetical protein
MRPYPDRPLPEAGIPSAPSPFVKNAFPAEAFIKSSPVIVVTVLIIGITDELPRGEDVARVRAQLALGGWPLADPHSA